jgi:hypothetical protein
MPKVRRGPNGPSSSIAGQQGTNKPTPHKNAGTSGMDHESLMTNKGDKQFYGPKAGGKGYRS